MKKNILTIIILALGLLNMILTAVIVFTVVPTTMRTNNLIAKVASSINLELESETTETTKTTETTDAEINIADIEVYDINEKEAMIINLKSVENDTKNHYASLTVSFSINKKAEDYKTISASIISNESYITEFIEEEFQKYTFLNVRENKNNIKVEILKRVQDYFKSDSVISVSVGKLILE